MDPPFLVSITSMWGGTGSKGRLVAHSSRNDILRPLLGNRPFSDVPKVGFFRSKGLRYARIVARHLNRDDGSTTVENQAQPSLVCEHTL